MLSNKLRVAKTHLALSFRATSALKELPETPSCPVLRLKAVFASHASFALQVTVESAQRIALRIFEDRNEHSRYSVSPASD